MKRLILVLVIALAVTAAVCAQSYTVQEVTGRVEREAGSDRWVTVTMGEIMTADTVIRTVVGSGLTVRDGDSVLTIGPMKNGKLSEISAGTASIQIRGRILQADTDAVRRTTMQIGTASARASDAAGEIEIEE